MKNKQRGAMSAEMLGYLSVVIALMIFVGSQSPKIWDKAREIHFGWQTSTVVQGLNSWKRGRTTFAGATIAKACATGDVPSSICGSSNNGKGTNTYGGDWSVTPNSGSAGLLDVTATIPEDGSKIAALADAVAPSTRGDCEEASGCSTISTTATSITMTF
ncbi:type 4 pilus major pilin [Vibrio europaeus]|uniref:type 4 pilus major pilin n=1 Tax=Vibrio europaeus TaxID=300876 RepID=UPI00233F44E4|nr:type 4 pilus major pilin [Vibrio europaeus]MDC5711154.1 type 4 pilus major pilin [Vibrio europaeus]MDC5713183.1 type 4 pilus major pilin [Vibrio europaeus]